MSEAMEECDRMAVLLRQRCAELAEFLVLKNRAYGSSASKPLRIFSRVSDLEQLLIRMDDKLSRIARGRDHDKTDESINDTMRDLAGYIVLYAVVSGEPPWCDLGEVFPPAEQYDQIREEMLADIDKELHSEDIWQGGRLDTVQWLVKEVRRLWRAEARSS